MVNNVSRASSNDLGINPDGSAVNPAAFQQHIRQDSNTMAQLLQRDPPLAQVILGNDLDELQNVLKERHLRRLEFQKQQEEFQKGIDENWEAALEHNPKAFARVVMLYLDMEVNRVPLKTFVDSGAQTTIISKSCAERCGLLGLRAQRFKGIAHGVGQSEILGKIHVHQLRLVMCSTIAPLRYWILQIWNSILDMICCGNITKCLRQAI